MKYHWAFVYYRSDGTPADRVDYHWATIEAAKRHLDKLQRNAPNVRAFRMTEVEELL